MQPNKHLDIETEFKRNTSTVAQLLVRLRGRGV